MTKQLTPAALDALICMVEKGYPIRGARFNASTRMVSRITNEGYLDNPTMLSQATGRYYRGKTEITAKGISALIDAGDKTPFDNAQLLALLSARVRLEREREEEEKRVETIAAEHRESKRIERRARRITAMRELLAGMQKDSSSFSTAVAATGVLKLDDEALLEFVDKIVSREVEL